MCFQCTCKVDDLAHGRLDGRSHPSGTIGHLLLAMQQSSLVLRSHHFLPVRRQLQKRFGGAGFRLPVQESSAR